MKWRHSVVYLTVLLLLGGFYYYFEVIKKTEKEAAEKEAKKVFHAQTAQIVSVELTQKDGKPIRLVNEGGWRLTEPLNVEADKAAVDGLLGALTRLETEREVAASPEDLKPFGLQEPQLTIRFQTADGLRDLLLGDPNPTGDARFAKTGDKPAVFLIAEGNWAVFNKGPNDLRRRQMFSLTPEEVSSVRVAWRDGPEFGVRLKEEGSGWTAPDRPDVVIKTRKVENLLEQIQWLRASGFIEDEVKELGKHGLDPPQVVVNLKLKSGAEAELKLSGKEGEKRQLAAVSSQLPAVAQVGATVLEEIPKDLKGFEDRSFYAFSKDNVKQLKWRKGKIGRHLVELGRDKWGAIKDEGPPDEIKEPWRVNTLLMDLEDSEFEEKADAAPPDPEKAYVFLDIMAIDKSLLSISWEKPSGPEAKLVTVRLDKGGAVEVVKMKAETLERIEQDLESLDPQAQSKEGA